MRVHDLNLVSTHQPSKFLSAFCVKRVSEWQRSYLLLCDSREFLPQWRIWSQGNVDIMPATREAIGEIGKMALAAAESLS